MKWLLAALMPCLALADDASVQKYRNFTPEQIKNLPEKTLQSAVPMMYTMAARKALSPGAELAFAMELNRLMYPAMGDYPAAIKAFQADLHDTASGILTVWQIDQLQKRSELQGLTRVAFPDPFFDIKQDDYASVQGTIKILDEKIAWPINHVTIECHRSGNFCKMDQFKLATPTELSWSQSYQVLLDSAEYYTVSRWTKDSIDAEPQETATGCRTTSMNLNFKTKEFYYITRNAGGDCDFLGQKLEKLAKPRIAQIVDGEKIIDAEFEKVETAAFDVLSSDFRKRVQALQSKAPSR